jgi:hypothetical protein
MREKEPTQDLEFYYVVSYRKGDGWSIAADIETKVFPDGTTYSRNTNSWDVAVDEVEEIDLKHYIKLKDALNLLNNGEE